MTLSSVPPNSCLVWESSYIMFQRKKLARLIACIVVGGSGFNSVIAQTPLGEVTVTSSKMDRSAADLTQSVSVIDEFEISNLGYTNLTEVLRNEASLEFKATGVPGQFNYPKMRGFASRHILVVIDGIKVNDGSSGDVGSILGQIDPDSIERVEILRGPQATLYGSNSTAGVIAITTKSGQSTDFSVTAEAGSDSWQTLGLSARGSTTAGDGSLIYSLNLDNNESDGVIDEEYTENLTIQGKLQYQGENFSIGGSYWRTDNEFGYAELNENYSFVSSQDEHWAFQTPDPNQRSATEKDVLSLFAEHTINENWSHRLTLGRDEKIYDTEDLNDGELGFVTAPFDDFTDFSCDYFSVYNAGDQVPVCDSYYVSVNEDTNRQADYNLNFSSDRLDILLGAEHYEQETVSNSNFGGYAGDQSVNSLYINGGVDLDADDRAILTFGVRHDDFDNWGSETTGSIGTAYDLTEVVNLFVNYGTSFRAPSTNELYSNYGNTELTPEDGDTFEAGVRGQIGALSGTVTYWHTELENVIAYDGSLPNPNSPFGFGQYTNRDEQVTKGVELDWSYALSEQLELRGTYTNTDSESTEGSDTFRTEQIADHKANLGLRYRSEKFNVGVNAYYSGPRLRWNGDFEMDSYTRVDLSGSYQFTDNLRVYGRVENLFDEDIVEGSGYEQPGTYGIFGIEVRL